MKSKNFRTVGGDSDPQKHQKHRRGDLAKQILLMLAAGVAIPAAFLMPNIPIALKPLLRALMEKNHVSKTQSLIRSITYLKRKRLVSLAQRGNQQILTLSENGRKRVMKYDLDHMVIKKPKRWDGHWRIVLFDIPEEKKSAREALRTKLKQLGFLQLQKSCFVYPFQCKAEIEFVSELFEVSPYINFIVAKELEGQEMLQRYFAVS